MSGKKKILFLIVVMLSNIVIMGDNLLYPISSMLYAAFPNDTSLVNYILSGPQLLIVVTALIAPSFLKKISEKKLMVLGCLLFVIGAVFSIAIPSAPWMAVMRTLVGIGQGLINVTAVSLILWRRIPRP